MRRLGLHAPRLIHPQDPRSVVPERLVATRLVRPERPSRLDPALLVHSLRGRLLLTRERRALLTDTGKGSNDRLRPTHSPGDGPLIDRTSSAVNRRCSSAGCTAGCAARAASTRRASAACSAAAVGLRCLPLVPLTRRRTTATVELGPALLVHNTRSDIAGSSADRFAETKAAFKTTEFVVFVVAFVGVLIASALVGDSDGRGDVFLADKAWFYVTLLAVGYMISRGLAKSGVRAHRDA